MTRKRLPGLAKELGSFGDNAIVETERVLGKDWKFNDNICQYIQLPTDGD